MHSLDQRSPSDRRLSEDQSPWVLRFVRMVGLAGRGNLHRELGNIEQVLQTAQTESICIEVNHSIVLEEFSYPELQKGLAPLPRAFGHSFFNVDQFDPKLCNAKRVYSGTSQERLGCTLPPSRHCVGADALTPRKQPPESHKLCCYHCLLGTKHTWSLLFFD